MSQTQKNSQKDEFVKVYLSDLIKGLQKFWWICVAAAVIAGGFKAVNERINYTPKYTSSAILTVSTQNTSSIGGVSVYNFYYDSTAAAQLSDIFPNILSLNILQDMICEDLDMTYMPASLSTSAVASTNMVTLTATGTDPQLTYDVLLSAIDNFPTAAKYVIGNIRFETISPPQVATSPSNKVNYLNEAVTGGAIGAVLGLLVIFVYVLQRRTIKSKKDIKAELNQETLAVIPHITFKKRTIQIDKSLLFTNSELSDAFKEAVRVMRNVFVSSLKENEKIVMATSSVPGEGKTTVITNLAISLADLNKKILLVDGDIRHPSVLPLLGIDPQELTFRTVSDEYGIAYVEKYKIHVLIPASCEKEETGYFNSGSIKRVLSSLRDKFDYILVDTPPCGLISDAMFIAQAADAAIYVIHQDAVRVSRIKSGLDNLMTTDINIIGTVLNGTASSILDYGYGKYGYGYGYGKYGYGYGYGYGEDSRHGKKRHHSSSKHS